MKMLTTRTNLSRPQLKALTKDLIHQVSFSGFLCLFCFCLFVFQRKSKATSGCVSPRSCACIFMWQKDVPSLVISPYSGHISQACNESCLCNMSRMRTKHQCFHWRRTTQCRVCISLPCQPRYTEWFPAFLILFVAASYSTPSGGSHGNSYNKSHVSCSINSHCCIGLLPVLVS